jgi:hypothetical protein
VKQTEEKAQPRSYAQTLCSKTTAPTSYRLRTLEPPKEDPKKERQVVIKLGEQKEVEALRKLPTKDLLQYNVNKSRNKVMAALLQDLRIEEFDILAI